MQRTKIDWADVSVNPMTGCRHGCPYCYAKKMANRLSFIDGTPYNRLALSGLDPFRPAYHADVAERKHAELIRKKRPLRVFYGSMGDIGCDGDFSFTDQVDGHVRVQRHGSDSRRVQEQLIDLARQTPQHTYCVLTKRPRALWHRIWPDNVHVGTSISASDGPAYNRILSLMQVQARTRWVSIEPLLNMYFSTSVLELRTPGADAPFLNWIVIGGLSRPTKGYPAPGIVDAAHRILLWARKHDIPCFVKGNMQQHDPVVAWTTEFPR